MTTPGDAAHVGPRHRWRVELLAKALGDAAPGNGPLLDAGCGRGTLAVLLARRGRQILAFDRSSARVRLTQQLAAESGVKDRVLGFVADITAIPLRDTAVVGTACGEVLEHVEADDAAAAELARTLSPGGVLTLTVPAGPARYGATDRTAGHQRRYAEADLCHLLVGAGLYVVMLRGWGYPFGRLYDRMVLAPAQRLRGQPSGRRLAGIGRWRWVDGFWRVLFELDEHWPAAGDGSGWLAVARRPEKLPVRGTGDQPSAGPATRVS